MEENWRFSTKPIVMLGMCMERGENDALDKRIAHYSALGAVVVVFRTAGGNVDEIESELREIAESGRLKKVEWYSHEDCGWVKACDAMLNPDPSIEHKKLSKVLFETARHVFGEMEAGENGRDARHKLMENHFHDYLVRRIKSIVGTDVDMDIRMHHERELRRSPGHDNYLVWTTPSDIKPEDIAKTIGAKLGKEVAVGSIYILQSTWDPTLLPDIEIALKFLGIKKVFAVEAWANAGKAEYRKGLLDMAEFKPSDVHVEFVEFGNREKRRL